jgi:hypothetical protein
VIRLDGHDPSRGIEIVFALKKRRGSMVRRHADVFHQHAAEIEVHLAGHFGMSDTS